MSTMSIPGVKIVKAADVQPDYGRWLLVGDQGTGKSTLASTIATLGKTLYVDMIGEHGTRSFQGAPYAGNIDVARPHTIQAMDDLFWALDKGGHGYKAVVLDSASAAQRMTMRFLTGASETAVREIQNGGRGADMQTWGRALDIMSDIATFWFGLADAGRREPMHVVIVAQTKTIEDSSGRPSYQIPDVQKGAVGTFLAAADYALWTKIEPNIEALGDESRPQVRHVVQFGADPSTRAKARVPMDLWGKIPQVMGRNGPTSLGTLSQVLHVGGVPAAPATPVK